MSNMQIHDLCFNSLHEMNEQEIKQVVGGFVDTTIIVQPSTQIALNIATVAGIVSGTEIGQNAQNNSFQFAFGVS